jgi:hypothetical protein
MADKKFPQSGLPIRKTVELLPTVFRTNANDKFMSAVVDPLVQPGVLQKLVGYSGRRYGKTYNGTDIYLDNDNTLRSRYQLEPGVTVKNSNVIENFYDYLDFKNQLNFFGNTEERDDKITSQEHYSWNPPIEWDKFINYREYYWEPAGPPSVSVYGQQASVTSTYRVALGLNSFIFTPDSFTNNPTITLYRGQTYKFIVDAPNEGMSIKTNYDTGSLIYNPANQYLKGQLAIYNGSLWRAKHTIPPLDGSSIDLETQDWEFVELISSSSAFNYNKGVTNNGIQKGTLTFEVPYDSPDVLFYQGLISPDRFGRFIIADSESNTKINIDKEILGKTTYTSSNGVKFTNGLIVSFNGQITPLEYSQNSWLVEGVGTAITLTKFSDLVVPALSKNVPDVLFDNEGFDTEPFDDASSYPGQKDYVTINRNSVDANPWSRYNRWFHRSVLEYAYAARGQDFPAAETARAKRPIIEFKSNIQLINHGAIAKASVDYIDDYTSDIFSIIEGSAGYIVDGESLFDGARILVTADTDSLANNKIYQVDFIIHNGSRQITLRETDDAESVRGQGVLVRRGVNNAGSMFHFTGQQWTLSQQKTAVNQPPKFDVFDNNGVSFADQETYPVSTFIGSNLIGYKVGNSVVDTELGFSISYLNIDNVGDIQFEWNWETDNFQYTINRVVQNKKISTGFFKINPNDNFENGWTKTDLTYIQPIIDSVIIKEVTNTVSLTTINWRDVTSTTKLIINFYLNGKKINYDYTRNLGTFTFDRAFAINDVLVIKAVTDLPPDTGYYEIPVSLEKNPLNAELSTFTLGQAIDHISSAMEFNSEFTGPIPGNSNLRDITNYQQFSKRFLKHSGLAPLAISLLCDRNNNIIKSLQYGKKSYTDFKNNFLNKSTEINYNNNIVNFVDDILNELTKTKTSNSPFADSDMLGNGAYTSINYTVEDAGINTFALSEKFSLNELSRRAVYVYLNDRQLLNKKEYLFNATFGFVNLLISINEGDRIEIREYSSTAFNHIPPTPTSLGLYKKYTPMKFLDDTYVEPREVIQGHDGSITFAYGDFRDELLLELEYRIYNNIKQEYDETVFDIDAILGGYYNTGIYSKSQLDSIVNQEFLKWIQNTNINYTNNTYFDSENSFTYTYNKMTDPAGSINLPGWWRGVYQWFYDTDRPHRCPWEMLGFSEQPDWWEDQYGAAPYTRNNLLLWEDLRDGIIRQGSRSGTYNRYKRPTLMQHLPVDGDGKLLSPLDSNLAGNFALINNRGSFVLGDMSPVEHAWRSSSEWPFAVVLALCLMKPFEFITDNFDRSKTTLNLLNQTINSDTGLFTTLSDIVVPTTPEELSSGLVKYLVSYLKSKGMEVTDLKFKIQNLDVNLSTRLSGFVDKGQQKYLLDSKNPNSSNSSIFIPPENYDIIFNVSTPIASVAYSGVILEKTEGGWLVNGYDDVHPYFNYYVAAVSQQDPLISVGGVSETFIDWAPNRTFSNGQIVRLRDVFYRAITTHISTTVFETKNWKKLPKLPTVGSVDALRRRTFNNNIKQLSYGTKLTTIQEVVDFLLGYDKYLQTIGFTFNRYDAENKTSQDWQTSCKEFMFWTTHNWDVGALITLSPAASKVDITVPVGVADSILDGFYNYQVLKADGKPLPPNFIDVNRTFQNITVETTNTTEGIYYLKVYYVLKEHVTVFSDRTVFNDVIYDKTTGYRQERIKTQGYRTVDWDGDYTSPGFLFDNVDIQVWQPFTDYRLGDIVAYKSYNWTSLKNQLGVETFDDTNWSKLDTTPEKQLISNFDYKIKEIEDYYEAASEGIGEEQRKLARHAVGYQSREYLQNLSADPVTQFQLYQGFIRDKGTANAITKVFDKLSRSTESSITLNEEWAFRVGSFGGTDQLKEYEIRLVKNNFQIDPQPLLITASTISNITDQNYRVIGADFTVSQIPFSTIINPTSIDVDVSRTAGYVKLGQTKFTVASLDDILNLDITSFVENDHVWITFDEYTWSVLRFNENALLTIVDAVKTNNTVDITLSRLPNLQVGDIIGIRDIPNLTGFFKITKINGVVITVDVATTAQAPELDPSTLSSLHLFTDARFKKYGDIDPRHAALLKNGSRLWIDDNGDSKWEIVEKTKQFTSKSITEYGTTAPLETGTKVLYDNNLKETLASMPASNLIISYVETATGIKVKQIITPSSGFTANLLGSFGKSMAISADSRWLIVGSPNASAIRSNYRGIFDSSKQYLRNDIILFAGKLWKAKTTIRPNAFADSTINLGTEDWEPATLIETTTSGSGAGYTHQGMISIYEYSSQQWIYRTSFVSPRPAAGELFGTEVAIGVNSGTYTLAVSAVDSLDGRGRVYLYTNNGTTWSHLENTNYVGIYDPTGNTVYYEGSIVWQPNDFSADAASPEYGNLWRCVQDSTTDGSTITLESSNWVRIDPISTQNSLPTSPALDDDGSTLANLLEQYAGVGTIDPLQTAELIKVGDKFGSSLAMNRDGSILVVGAPYSDGQYFANYKGVWKPTVEYVEGDVVRYDTQYYKLSRPADDIDLDSSGIYRSYNQNPTAAPWDAVGDSTSASTGKIFIYQKTQYGNYELRQTITTDSINDINDLESGITFNNINVGDRFGHAMDMDYTGSTLVVTSPRSDLNFINQGSAYVFKTNGFANLEYRLTQQLESFETYPNEWFGESVSISSGAEKIVVGAKNSPFVVVTEFDSFGTIWDEGKTRFADVKGFAGGVYVFDRKDDEFFLTEKLEANLSPYESFGSSVDCTYSTIAVGSPNYKQPVIDSNTSAITYPGEAIGIVRLFNKDPAKNSWNTLSTQQPLVDISQIKSIALYDDINNVKIQDIDYVDHAKLKILNIAEQEIKFKTVYDPAVYSIGTENQTVDPTQAWKEKNVGEIWWDLSKAKWLYYEQDDLAYRLGNWNTLTLGASIDVYEWVETVLLPSEWSALADTNEGLAEGISGQPLYPNDDVYAIKEIYNTTTGLLTGTLYYYWVKNKVTTPENMPSRRISAASVASLIRNPGASGTAFISLIDADKFLLYNFNSIISTDSALLNIQFLKNTNNKLNSIHNEYQLLTEGVADSIPTVKLETKWIDSLAGSDIVGNRVPDPTLAAKQRYGISFRPRQGMFVDRLPILETVVTNINSILKKEPFADLIDFNNLNLTDTAPAEVLNLYDITVDNEIDLIAVGTARLRTATLQANIVDGEIDTIDIINSGFGYKVVPPIEFEGTGTGAKATATIDRQGRISSVTVTSRGKKYSSVVAKVRDFSVLVTNDSTINNYWSIYGWNNSRKVFSRTRSQAFETTRYWSKVDWWKDGYSFISRIVVELPDITSELTIDTSVGDLIRIKEYANGGWAIFEKISNTGDRFTDRFTLVGRQNGTIELSKELYNTAISGIGFDNTQSFDSVKYDVENALELRNILKAIKEDIFTGDYATEWNKLFFTCIRYVFAEQQYVDWAFKTSFLNATHNVGLFEQKLNYKNDNLESFQEYINEVKPYRTTVREYVSKYDNIDISASAAYDFDLPATYSETTGKIEPVKLGSAELASYPWKWWADNLGFSITSIDLYDGGAGYTSVPTVLIEGNGTGATAQAYISNGKVVGITVTNSGTGYTQSPTVSLVGGNNATSSVAKAVAVLGNSNIRSFNLSVKFDRITKTGIYESFDQSQQFTANGFSSVFELNYAPTRDKNKITIYKNNRLVLNDEYSISLYISTIDTYSLLKGKLIFVEIPEKDDVIEIVYEKNDALLDSVNRINKYYFPTEGMKGKELNQLMTGVDFGGVQIQGTTFDVTGGWDALPWFTDNWDSVESAADYYYVLNIEDTSDSSTVYKPGAIIKLNGMLYEAIKKTIDRSNNIVLPIVSDDWEEYWKIFKVKLPFVPANGQQITVYLKRAGVGKFGDIQTLGPNTAPVVSYETSIVEPATIRIDDPFYNDQVDSSTSINPEAQMPTFVGDGITDTIEIAQYVDLNTEDILIFRPIESDGSVTITDANLLDTNISGGTFSTINSTGSEVAPNAIDGIYEIARGRTAEEIVLDGDKFISPDQVPAPEENIPGQVVDSVSIRVFNSTLSGSAPLQSKTILSDGVTKSYKIGLDILETSSLLVYVDKVKYSTDATDSTVEYTVDLIANTITFSSAPEAGSVIELLAFGVGGINLLDYQEFIADGETNLFLTSARYADTSSIYVTVNGEFQDVEFTTSTGLVDVDDKTIVQFGVNPNFQDVIKIICFGAALDTDSTGVNVVRVNQQIIAYDGSTSSYDLDNFVNLSRSSARSSMVVEINGRALRGLDTNYVIYDGTTNTFKLGVDPFEPSGAILTSNIAVYINNELKTVVQDYVYDGTAKDLIIEPSILTIGDKIKIENDFRTEYSIVGNNLVLADSVVSTLQTNDDSTIKDLITVTWFSEYPSMELVSDEYVGGKVNYILSQIPLDANYVWVYKNGIKLVKGVDYYVKLPRGVVYLTRPSTDADLIKIVVFGSDLYKSPSAFEIHKDMLNIYHFKRFSKGSLSLIKDLNYYDQTILISGVGTLDDPKLNRNIPGSIYINAERIEFMKKVSAFIPAKEYAEGDTVTYNNGIWKAKQTISKGDGSTIDFTTEDWQFVESLPAGTTMILSQLRRGTQGTSIPTVHNANSDVVDIGVSETLPYNENQERIDFISDGSSLLIGPLEFIPSTRKDSLGVNKQFAYKQTIPTGYYPCDQLEIFAAGQRLKKDPVAVYDETLGANSPLADKMIEAEFSVDGSSNYIRLTNPIPAGSRISIITKTGRIWYERAETQPSKGLSLLDNNTPVAKFIAQKTTKLPE